MSFKIVILSAQAGNLVPCVQAILEHEPDLEPRNIIVVDDGARKLAERQLPDVTWVTGQKPFVFARNANLGLAHAQDNTILINDDALLITPRGFSQLSEKIQKMPEIGICSAAIQGVIGNPRQKVTGNGRIRFEPKMLAFVCVYLPKTIFQQVGPLDERFVGYGFDDNDYCTRVLAAGFQLAIWDGCVVDHSGKLPSSYRTQQGVQELFHNNQRLYQNKWNGTATARQVIRSKEKADGVDLLYLAWNRLEFTKETFTTMVKNTDWELVNELFVYDDGSQDGTREWLEQAVGKLPGKARFVTTDFGSPVTAMSHFIESARASVLAKVDNDAMMPPGWLRQSLDVVKRHPELTMLGIEAMNPVQVDPTIERTYTPAIFISGLGLYRREAFARSRPKAMKKYFGLEEWQQAQGHQIKTGWITPALPVFLLDRMPYKPWLSYSERYVQQGWQRAWPKYNPEDTLWHWRWTEFQPDSSSINGKAEVHENKVQDNEKRHVETRLNIALLGESIPGYDTVSLYPETESVCVDLQQRWPWDDDTFTCIRAWEVCEHLPDKLFTMNELWRVLCPDGQAEIALLTTEGPGAWADPTHVSFWNRRSFLYFEAGNPYRERFADSYGIKASFRVLNVEQRDTADGPLLIIRLAAVK